MTSFRPRCRKPMRPSVPWGAPRGCGRPAGHPGRCLSVAAYDREKAAKIRRQRQARSRAAETGS